MSGGNYTGVATDNINPAVIQMQGVGSTKITRMYVIRQTLTPAQVAAATTVEQTFTVPGLAVGDAIDINKASHQTGLSIGNVRVSAANTLAIQFVNTTSATPITPASEVYTIGGMA